MKYWDWWTRRQRGREAERRGERQDKTTSIETTTINYQIEKNVVREKRLSLFKNFVGDTLKQSKRCSSRFWLIIIKNESSNKREKKRDRKIELTSNWLLLLVLDKEYLCVVFWLARLLWLLLLLLWWVFLLWFSESMSSSSLFALILFGMDSL